MGTADLNPESLEESGIIPRIIQDVFNRIGEEEGTTYSLKSTYLEVSYAVLYILTSRSLDDPNLHPR